MLPLLRARLSEVTIAVAPLVGAVCLLQVVLVHAPTVLFVQFLLGSGLGCSACC